MGRIGKVQLEKEMMAYFCAITKKPILLIEVISVEKPRVVLSVDNMIVLFMLDTYELYSLFAVKALLAPANEAKDAAVDNNRVVYESELFFQEAEVITSLSGIAPESNNGESCEEEQLVEENRADISGCKKPSVHMLEKRMHIAGLSAVLRFLLKFACRRQDLCENEWRSRGKNVEMLDKLLGYQRGCLQACAESSIWTKFCEVDMIQTVRALRAQLLQLVSGCCSGRGERTTGSCCLVDEEIPLSLSPSSSSARPRGLFEFPKDLLRLEYHLTRPVRIHNFRKRIQQNDGANKALAGGERKGNNHNRNHRTHADRHDDADEQAKLRMNGQSQEGEEKKLLPPPPPLHPEQISHDFAEGPDLTLADLLLFPCVDLAFRLLGLEMFQKYLPTLSGWHERLSEILPLSPSHRVTFEEDALSYENVQTALRQMEIHIPEIPEESLYKSDPLRYKAKLRLFTKQHDIESALRFLSSRGIQALNFNEDKMPPFDWDSLPRLVHPEGGLLPPSRIQNKSYQLSNLAQMVVKVFEENYESEYSSTGRRITIVDFCSGGGHLGILLAYILPQCEVILVENKEESLRRAESRVKTLGLPNISFFQCNLDYFTGHFEIGVALHACGTATDLVLTKCVGMRASFVCCPCCYGAIQSNHMLHYPRSSTFVDAVRAGSSSSNSSWDAPSRSETESEAGGGPFSLKHYFVLGHAADQTHDEGNEKTQQGKVCMRMIDTDRCSHARENNYDVSLRRMQPSTCSPKNHILVGAPTTNTQV